MCRIVSNTVADLKPPALATRIDTFRRFKRVYTRFLGTLNERFLNTNYSLAEGLDAGCLSRLLTKFERDGLLRKRPSDTDGRSTHLMLTARGRSALNKLDTLANQQAHN